MSRLMVLHILIIGKISNENQSVLMSLSNVSIHKVVVVNGKNATSIGTESVIRVQQ